MAKTRIKTTPTRMQKEAQTASAAVNSSSNRIVTEQVLKKRICALNSSMLSTKETLPIQTSIIVQPPPKRTNSISSATSTISHTSDGHCSSSIESPPPSLPSSSSATTPPTSNSNGPTMDELTENAIKTLNAGLLAKTNALALKNRKVYMITEKCDDSGADGVTGNGGANCASGNGAGGNCASGTAKGQKRKMYLIMEEKQTDDVHGNGLADKFMKSENGGGTKKLTLFADSTNGQLPQKIEKILPEILSCIQAKGTAATTNGNGLAITLANTNGAIASTANQDTNGKPTVINDNLNTNNIRLKTQVDNNNERLPLTLPPKKNRTKIITTQIIPVNNNNNSSNSNSSHPITSTLSASNNNNNNEQLLVLKEPHSLVSSSLHSGGNSKLNFTRSDNSSATPVIVKANTLLSNGITASTNGVSKENGNKYCATTISSSGPAQLHKNINLSTDFLFLMKMLPKLESIAEPHKTYVKACIEDLINQYVPPGVGDQ